MGSDQVSPPVEESAVVGVALFAGLDGRQAASAARNLRKITLAPAQILFGQGDRGDTVYVLVAGGLDVYARGHDAEHHLATLEPGAILGHLGLLIDEPRSATVIARAAAELWEVDRGALQAAVEAGEVWAGRFLLATARQLAMLFGSVSRHVIALVEEAGSTRHDEPAARVVELEELRRRLFSEWAF